jgi:hypothetical protein
VLGQSDRSVTVRVSSVPAAGGTVVLSRLAWPGYSTTYGGLVRPVDGYLLTLSLPASAAGQTVTVRFDPPGWHLELACLVAALLGGLAWSATAFRRAPNASTTEFVDRPRTDAPARS